MDITFEQYDKIVQEAKDHGFCIEDYDLMKIKDVERIMEKDYSIEFLICLLEMGDFSNNPDLKKEINEILKRKLHFID